MRVEGFGWMEHKVFSEILPSILEGLEVLDALRVIGKSAHGLDDGILTFHNLLRLLGGCAESMVRFRASREEYERYDHPGIIVITVL